MKTMKLTVALAIVILLSFVSGEKQTSTESVNKVHLNTLKQVIPKHGEISRETDSKPAQGQKRPIDKKGEINGNGHVKALKGDDHNSNTKDVTTSDDVSITSDLPTNILVDKQMNDPNHTPAMAYLKGLKKKFSKSGGIFRKKIEGIFTKVFDAFNHFGGRSSGVKSGKNNHGLIEILQGDDKHQSTEAVTIEEDDVTTSGDIRVTTDLPSNLSLTTAVLADKPDSNFKDNSKAAVLRETYSKFKGMLRTVFGVIGHFAARSKTEDKGSQLDDRPRNNEHGSENTINGNVRNLHNEGKPEKVDVTTSNDGMMVKYDSTTDKPKTTTRLVDDVTDSFIAADTEDIKREGETISNLRLKRKNKLRLVYGFTGIVMLVAVCFSIVIAAIAYYRRIERQNHQLWLFDGVYIPYEDYKRQLDNKDITEGEGFPPKEIIIEL